MSFVPSPASRRTVLGQLGMAAGTILLTDKVAAATPRADVAMLAIQAVTPEALAPYGGMLGKPFPEDKDAVAFRTPAVASWRQQLFDVGAGGEVEIVWVEYKVTNPEIGRLEMHGLTEQAVVPLTGQIIQVLALSGADGKPDLSTLKAFRVTPGMGICMGKGVWHTTRSLGSTCLMLTRGSTSVDILKHRAGAPLVETVMLDITPCRLAGPIGA